jgi:hypothetical protein
MGQKSSLKVLNAAKRGYLGKRGRGKDKRGSGGKRNVIWKAKGTKGSYADKTFERARTAEEATGKNFFKVK